MHGANTGLNLLGLPGSLRRDAYSLSVLRGVQAVLPPSIALTIRDVRLPLYDADHDGPAAPADITGFRDQIARSDGLVIVTPEYNHGVPGVLKNALDWASRPKGQSVLAGKPVLIASTSPAFTGGVRAQAQLHQTLLAVEARIAPGPEIVIGNVADRIRDGKLVDEAHLNFLSEGIERLAALVRDARRATAPRA